LIRAAATIALGLLASPAGAHGLYSDLRSPDTGVSCCHDQDCHPTSMCKLPDGTEGIVSRVWGCEKIQWSKVLKQSSPDGEAHLCEPVTAAPTTTPITFCILLGAAS
jgi:hypothetical protein